MTLSGDGPAERLETNFVSRHYFSLLGVEPVLGRVFTAEEHAVPMAHPVAALAGAAAFLLLIGCANATHLLLVQASSQRRSLVLLLALGLPRPRLVRQLLVGGVATALPAGLAALVLGRLGTEILLERSPTSVPGFVEVSYGAGVVLAGLGLTLVTGVVFGLVPVLDARRADLQVLLHEGSRGSAGREAGRFRSFLIAADRSVPSSVTSSSFRSRTDRFQFNSGAACPSSTCGRCAPGSSPWRRGPRRPRARAPGSGLRRARPERWRRLPR